MAACSICPLCGWLFSLSTVSLGAGHAGACARFPPFFRLNQTPLRGPTALGPPASVDGPAGCRSSHVVVLTPGRDGYHTVLKSLTGGCVPLEPGIQGLSLEVPGLSGILGSSLLPGVRLLDSSGCCRCHGPMLFEVGNWMQKKQELKRNALSVDLKTQNTRWLARKVALK